MPDDGALKCGDPSASLNVSATPNIAAGPGEMVSVAGTVAVADRVPGPVQTATLAIMATVFSAVRVQRRRLAAGMGAKAGQLPRPAGQPPMERNRVEAAVDAVAATRNHPASAASARCQLHTR
jgi:hypothetical protein